jgi:hypothetical protein
MSATTPTLAPNPDEVRERRSRSTSPSIWIAALLALCILLWTRLQQIRPLVIDRLHETPEFDSIEQGPAIELAIGVGSLLGFIVSACVSALYFSLASVLESNILPSLRLKWGSLKIGPLSISSITSILYLQFLAVILNVPSAKGEWFGFTVVGIIGCCAPLIFRRQWRHGSMPAQLWIFGLSIAIAAAALLF